MSVDRFATLLYGIGEAAAYLSIPPSTLTSWAYGYERRVHGGGIAEAAPSSQLSGLLPEDHALAARAYVRAEDLARETFPHWRGVDDGVDGPEVAELIPLVRIGRVIARREHDHRDAVTALIAAAVQALQPETPVR